jgi:hypothetical protein
MPLYGYTFRDRDGGAFRLDISLFAFVDYALPWVVAVVAIALYLGRRPISPLRAWLITLTVALLLTVAVTLVLRGLLHNVVPTASLLKSYSALYLIPASLLTAVALAMRSRLRSRILGAAILIVLFLATSAVARRVSGLFFDLVNASG